MKIASFSLLRLPFTISSTRHRFFSAVVSSTRHQNPNKPNKNLLKARETINRHHNFSTLQPILSHEDQPHLSNNQAIGTVASSQANFMRVIIHEASVELLCVVKAVLKKIKRRVLVGDKVLVGSIDWVDKRGAIENVFKRKSEILDPPVANVDHLLVLFSMDQPKIEPFSLTRFLVEAESTGIPLTLALNKSELVSQEEIKAWKSRLRSWAYEPIFCSIESKHGLDTLQFIMREQTSVIVGPSGVGKSSLINALRGNKHILGAVEDRSWFDPILGSKWYDEQRVGEVSVRSGRGKHTTRHVSLLPLPDGGYLADTPGFNQPSLIKVTKNSLAHHFPEIRKMLKDSEPANCAFNNCLHLGEPGCLVKGDWERYPYYLQLLDEIKIREEFQLRTIGTKREGDVRCKVGDKGVVQAEPRLEPKKYRRQSRKRVNQSLLDELDELDDEDDTLEDDNPILRAMKEENQ
ncbi:small ribosomal subunit biogenesis GTPase RsgA 1, mitochondrial isoform X2 [Lycium ferocissimum]|uniref:small ribosomal subunit biogenesis GTPase RsgA 1, mitochondrial isoform X2 n=1 Tax=Lycium ferocissimum TaxID=112874 RepID=UPI00281657F1|nr:small ribosomal subunit biogenesis GTPase RsgA 1, mitochondrial isoform X2 [Lycium ferocissimum]